MASLDGRCPAIRCWRGVAVRACATQQATEENERRGASAGTRKGVVHLPLSDLHPSITSSSIITYDLTIITIIEISSKWISIAYKSICTYDY